MKKQLTDKQIIKRILKHFKDSIGTKKYYLVFIVGFITSITSVLEPFLFFNIINYIESFYKGGEFLGKKSGELYSKLNKGIKDSFALLFFFFMDILPS